MTKKYRTNINIDADAWQQIDALYPGMPPSAKVVSLLRDFLRIRDERDKLLANLMNSAMKNETPER